VLRKKSTLQKKSDHCYSVLSYYHERVEITIKSYRLYWLKSVDDNLKTKPKDLWKYISEFRTNDHVVTQLKIGENLIIQPQCIIEAFCESFFFDF
jgi:hypothetical protein